MVRYYKWLHIEVKVLQENTTLFMPNLSIKKNVKMPEKYLSNAANVHSIKFDHDLYYSYFLNKKKVAYSLKILKSMSLLKRWYKKVILYTSTSFTFLSYSTPPLFPRFQSILLS